MDGRRMVRCRVGRRFSNQPARHAARSSGLWAASQGERRAGLTLRRGGHAAPAFDEESERLGPLRREALDMSKPPGIAPDGRDPPARRQVRGCSIGERLRQSRVSETRAMDWLRCSGRRTSSTSR